MSPRRVLVDVGDDSLRDRVADWMTGAHTVTGCDRAYIASVFAAIAALCPIETEPHGDEPRPEQEIRADIAAWCAEPPGRTVDDRRRFLDTVSSRLAADVEPLLAAKEVAEAERDRLRAILDGDWVAAADHVKVIKRAFDAEDENERLLIRTGAAVQEARQWRAVVENRSVSDLVARAERAEAELATVRASSDA